MTRRSVQRRNLVNLSAGLARIVGYGDTSLTVGK